MLSVQDRFNIDTTMKRRAVLLTLLALGMVSCDFRVGANVDIESGLESSNSGLSFSKSKVDVNHQPFNKGPVYCGETLEIQFHGVGGFVVTDGKIYPNLRIVVTEQSGASLMSKDNLYEGRGYPEKEATALTATLKLNDQYAGKNCKFHVHFSDTKGNGRIDAVLPVNVEPLNTPELKVQENGLTATQKGITSEYGRVVNAEAPLGGQIGLLLYGLTGFREVDGKVYPGAKVELFDPNSGSAVYQSEDVFAKQDSQIDPEQAKTMRIFLSPEKSESGKQYLWKFQIWDKQSDAKFLAEILLKFK
jgi:hypothetical protein